MADAANHIVRSCAQCSVDGCEAGASTKGFCPRHYQRHRKGQPLSAECAHCGNRTLRPKFCSQKCILAHKIKRRSEQRARASGRIDSPVSFCVVCHSAFERKAIDGPSKIYCSRTCNLRAFRRRNGHRALPLEVVREQAIYAKWSRRAKAAELQWVKDHMEWKRQRRLDHERIADEIRRALHKCGDCGRDEPDLRRDYCSPCAGKRMRMLKRISRDAGKARKRVQTVERVDPIKVFDRDGWRCHMCRRHTPRRLRGSFDPRAPELEHIVPLSKGGEHSYRNTACSCRECNLRKGDKVFGQLHLGV